MAKKDHSLYLETVSVQQKLFSADRGQRFALVQHRDELGDEARHKLDAELGEILPVTDFHIFRQNQK